MIELLNLARRKYPKAPMEELSMCEIGSDFGLEGDSRGKVGRRQLTVLSWQAWQAACGSLGVELSWLLRRANLLISGYEFTQSDVGRTINIGQVVLQVTRETDPCERMDAQHLGLYDALLQDWRGGVCCQVVHGGRIKVGDTIEVSD